MQTNLPTILQDDFAMSKDLFVLNYKELLRSDIASGQPSDDTLVSYYSAIDSFLAWCAHYNLSPLDLIEQHLKAYRDDLINKRLKVTSIAFKLTAVRRFYQSAMRWHIIGHNPVEYVSSGRDPNADLLGIKYITAGKFEYLINCIDIRDENNKIVESRVRDRTIILFMGIEGLRTVEISRMSIEDIDREQQTILIHGKGHNNYIFPRPDTFATLERYLEIKSASIPDQDGAPVFTAVGNRNGNKRITRSGIRKAVNFWFSKAGIRQTEKDLGLSCHLLRHTCGTLLYQETKDLQLVKETLRHKDLKMSSRYAHLQDRLLNRYTRAIPIKPPEDL